MFNFALADICTTPLEISPKERRLTGVSLKEDETMDSIKSALNKYFDFKGRATRKEYWTFYFFTLIVAAVFGLVEGLLGITGLSNLVILALIIPTISCAVRRMHDAGKSGWFIIVPLVNFVFLLSASVSKGTENQSGTIASS